MTTQTELPIKIRKGPGVDENDSRIDRLIDFLEGKDWMTADEISVATKWNDRLIRALASNSKGRILSGQSGYKLTLQSTPEERDHAIAFLTSQAKEMLKRAIEIGKIHRKKTA
jgi:hypothetical protein